MFATFAARSSSWRGCDCTAFTERFRDTFEPNFARLHATGRTSLEQPTNPSFGATTSPALLRGFEARDEPVGKCQGKAPVYISPRCVILLFAFRLSRKRYPENPKADGGVRLWLESRNAFTCLRKAGLK